MELEISKLVKYDNDNNRVVTTSKDIGEAFSKRHDSVLRDIENYKKDLHNFGEMFYESEYQDTYGRNQKQYLMNRDGFSLLAMGFTGSKALTWKLKYIEAFNTMEAELNSPEKVMARALKIADDTINNLTNQNTIQKQIIGELKPKADYLDNILQSKSLITITQIAKDYGMSSQQMNKLLHDLKVQYKQSKQWLLYSEYHDKGYTHSQTTEVVKETGEVIVVMNTKWTQKGRLFLYDLLKENNCLPLIERC